MTSRPRVSLLNFTPTSVASVEWGVQPARDRPARGRAQSIRMEKRFISSSFVRSVFFRLVRADLAEVGRVLVDVDRALDAVEERQAAAQLEELRRAGALEGAVDLLGAVRLGRLDQQVGLGMLLALVEV